MVDVAALSENELVELIQKGKSQLAAKQAESRKGVISQIHELAKSIGAKVDIAFLSDAPANRKGGKVPVKYSDGVRKWTGRGQKPRWLSAELAAGKSLDDFRVAG